MRTILLIFISLLVSLCVLYVFDIQLFGSVYVPESERQFINIMRKYHKKYNVVGSSDALLNERRKELMALDSGVVISDWLGIVRSIGKTISGDIRVDITVTGMNRNDDYIDNKVILRYFTKEENSFIKSLKSAGNNQLITFTGNFLDDFEEKSLTTTGGFEKPWFNINISSAIIGIKDGGHNFIRQQ